ncbi:PspC domain-containing protein [Planobispora siamensis]|uniref:Phage shock protein PspC N-terminal domain-containing protein n=1 Tax=Planobispora siamensis TaxID=936338 RepID=A0A8J3WJ63_9ACTN|nr:PspC domain-containing protein [Planobispora siamensis]GIH89536.1 hypothetical protein Psi01_01660 [Planobispora siamensis]
MTDTGSPQDPASISPDPPSTVATAAGEERRLRRSSEGRILTGVCAGLGRHARVDPVLFRVGFAMLVLASGVGVILYIAAFLLMREPDGAPGHMEQWTRRDFDAETVMALLTGVFAFGLIINLSSGNFGTPSLVVGTVFAVALLTAHARGVDLLALARTLPERLRNARRTGPAAASRPVAGHPEQGPTGFPPPPHAAYPPLAGPDAPSPPTAPYLPPPPAPPGPARPDADSPIAASSGPVPPDSARPDADSPIAASSGPASPGVDSRLTAAERDLAERTRLVNEAISAAHARMAAARDRLATRPPAGPADGGPQAPPTEPGHGGPQAPAEPGFGPHNPYQGSPAGPHPGPGPRPRLTPSFDSSGEPFAPYGPYRPLDPRRGPSPQILYDLAEYGRRMAPPPRPKQPRAFVGTITIFLAMIIGGIIMAVQSASGSINMTVAGSAMLITIGGGLLVATWFGRGAALVAAGTAVALFLIAGSAMSDVPKKFGSYDWAPATTSEIAGTYTVGVGEGTLDLGDLTFAPGSRTVIEASVSVGQITVILPPTVRAEVTGYAKLGDVEIDHSVQGGADVRHEKVLEPEVTPKGEVATIVLTVKAGVGDVEVTRAA